MEQASPSQITKQLEAQVRAILRQHDIRSMASQPRLAVEKLTQNLADGRVYSQDFELSETDEDRAKNARLAKKWLDQAQKRIITASQWDLFDPADVAHLSAQIEQVITLLR